MGVMYQARNASHLILIDARVPNNHPGAIFEVPGEIWRPLLHKAIICMIFAGTMRFMRARKSMVTPFQTLLRLF